jgi:adenylate cyclase
MTDGRKQVAAAVRDYIARQHISRDEFAFRTKLGKSTVDKLLIGLFSHRTLAIVEHHTKLSLRPMLGNPGAPSDKAPTETSPRPAARPSIAVLPFENLGGDPGQDYLADGITEDIITELARLRWLLVIARNSTFAYKGKAADVRSVARDLGVRYVLEGSVRAAGHRLRVTGQLVDAESGRHIWAERYDREVRDIFAVQDDITRQVVAAVEPHLYAEEGLRAARHPETIDAWGLVAQALQLVNRLERTRNAEAQRLLARAIEIEPDYATAHALLGWAIHWSAHIGWHPDPRQGYLEALAAAERAVALDGRDPWGRITLGFSRSHMGQHEQAITELREALTHNPNSALGHSICGWILLRAGHFDAAVEETRQALRLSPVDSFSGFYASTHALALLGSGRFEEALPHMRAAIATLPDYAGHYNMLISCCGHLGRLDEARAFLAARNRIAAPLRLAPLRPNTGRFAHWDLFLEGLEKAGVPE